MSFSPTPEQTAIVDAVRDTRDSLVVNALAGAAKTTTLALAAGAMRPVPTLCVAFNKRIADEMGKRLPSFIETKTLNSVGHGIWGRTIGRRLSLDTDKSYRLLSQLMQQSPPEERKLFGEMFATLLRASRSAKSAGYIPDRFASAGQRLADRNDFIGNFAADSDYELDDYFFSILDKVLEGSIAEAFEGKIDFDDQIYMSTLFNGLFPRYDTVMVDEAQDLSELNHLMLSKMVGQRLIAVGDPNQAIYAFRGAHHNSMVLLRDQFDAKELFLSTSFRCPKKVVEAARRRVPHMQYPDWAKEGHVGNLAPWGKNSIPNGSVILCRNSAPLFKVALRLLRQGQSVKILGNDIGKALTKIMEGFGPRSMSAGAALIAAKQWKEGQLESCHEARKAAIEDRYSCIEVFLEFGSTLEEAMAYATHLFEATGPITLMTLHKAKGGEWDTVFFLDPWLIPSKFARISAEAGDESKLEQEYNLRYVGQTRSKDTLYYVNSEDFE